MEEDVYLRPLQLCSHTGHVSIYYMWVKTGVGLRKAPGQQS